MVGVGDAKLPETYGKLVRQPTEKLILLRICVRDFVGTSTTLRNVAGERGQHPSFADLRNTPKRCTLLAFSSRVMAESIPRADISSSPSTRLFWVWTRAGDETATLVGQGMCYPKMLYSNGILRTVKHNEIVLVHDTGTG